MLLTHDARTMPVHFATHLGDREVPGLIIVPQSMGIGKAVQQLIFIWRTTEAEEWTNSISRLPLSWVP
jgi:hypothetical protein